MRPEQLFSQEDQQRIAETVKAAELATSGEIVPFVVGQSDQYPEAPLRLGFLTAFLVVFTMAILDIAMNIWLPFGIGEAAIYTVLGFGLGWIAGFFVTPLRRLVLQSTIMEQRVDERASMAFLAEEVFNTRERTGILIFLSLFERRVRVMGDNGINAKVEQEEWDGIVALIVDAMKNNQPAEGLIKAIERCGSHLEKSGVEIRDDDTNELDNSLRMSDK
ncbi:MAG: hypothetical protein CL946_05105 [Ectothiorhodospiraceae bacterium]|nr:hypothetical protein [Ectothiorhodospiraceae bacterium]